MKSYVVARFHGPITVYTGDFERIWLLLRDLIPNRVPVIARIAIELHELEHYRLVMHDFAIWSVQELLVDSVFIIPLDEGRRLTFEAYQLYSHSCGGKKGRRWQGKT